MSRTICWIPEWSESRPRVGLEHLILRDGEADGVVLAFNDDGNPFRLEYGFRWDASWQLREANLAVTSADSTRSLQLRTDGPGNWYHEDGRRIPNLDGCRDIDIWPTPFTNTFPIRRAPMPIGERLEFRMARVAAPDLELIAQSQAYTRLADRLYRFEALDGSGFRADLPVDPEGIVLDYPGLFRRIV